MDHQAEKYFLFTSHLRCGGIATMDSKIHFWTEFNLFGEKTILRIVIAHIAVDLQWVQLSTAVT